MSICPKCNMIFTRRGNMNQHLRQVHRREKNYGCPCCEYRSTRKNHMDTHIAANHQPMVETVVEVEVEVAEPVEVGGEIRTRTETRTKIKREWGHSWKDGVPIVTETGTRPRRSRGERLIAGILNDLGVDFVSEKSFDDLRGIGGGPLRFDFEIRDGPRYLLIEYDGEGHFGPVRFGSMGYYEAVRAYHRTRIHDEMKDEYCEAKGHPLLRVSYREEDQARYLVTSFIEDNLGRGSESDDWRVSPSPTVSETQPSSNG